MSAYTQKDYEAIEAAVLESPRGRWFLGEFARRHRAADTLMLLEAIRRLERGVAETPDMAQGELTGENLSFFAGDEDLFESAPAASAPSLSVVGGQQERNVTAGQDIEAPKGDPKDRIVFIRRASSKETSIPLADEAEAAGGSQSGS
ncbi:MAG TPA: hypothetical protein VMO81_08515 [Aestuariivirgaceae bacterium]|nr:hypothetical protein [Aestuariivirgaceae bacterium]